MPRYCLCLFLTIGVLFSGSSAAGQPKNDDSGPCRYGNWTTPDTISFRGEADSFSFPDFASRNGQLYFAANTVSHPRLLGRSAMIERSARYRSSSSLWVGRITDPAFSAPKPISRPQGDFLFLFPVADVGPRGVLHLAWAEMHPDSLAQYRSPTDLSDRPFPKRIYHARYDGKTWSDPQMIYRSTDDEDWGRANLIWDRDHKGAFQVGPEGRVHLVFSHRWRHVMVHVHKQVGGSWQVDTLRYEDGYRARGGNRALSVGKNGRLAVAYGAYRTAVGLESAEVRVARTRNRGDTWKRATILEPIARINNKKGGGSVRHLELTGYPGDTLHVVWGRKTKRIVFSAQELWHAWSADGGKTWTTPSPIDLPENSHFDDLKVVRDRCGTLHALIDLASFKNNDATQSDLFYTTWTPGDGWAEFQPLTLASKHVQDAGFALWRDRLHLMWSQMPLPFKYSSPVTILKRTRPLHGGGELGSGR